MRLLSLLLVLATISVMPAISHAEEWATPAVEKPKPAKKKVVKKAAKTVPAIALPSAPIPYLASTSSLVKGTVTAKPLPVTPSVNPVHTPEPTVPSPPPPPTSVVASVTVVPANPREITLRCETLTTVDKKTYSRGEFTLSLTPSETFPDTSADFKVMSIDPNHRSIIRETLCFTFRCNASVNISYYEMLDQPQKKGDYLKMSLNRNTGAFYGQKVTTMPSAIIGGKSLSTLDETGYCRPEKAATKVLF